MHSSTCCSYFSHLFDSLDIPWALLNSLASTNSSDDDKILTRDQLRSIFTSFHEKYTKDLAQAKRLITKYAGHYDTLVARLQLLEQSFGNQLVDKSYDELNPGESDLAQMLECKPTETKIFDFHSDLSVLKLHQSPTVAVSCFSLYRDAASQVNLDAPDDLITKLRYYNQKYLTLGLAWKKKCEEAELRIKQLMTERVNEMQELSKLINDLPSQSKQ